MSYVNFEEEKVVANQQIENRIKNNKKIYKTIINDRTYIDIQYDSRYSFNKFENRTFNNSQVKGENEFLKVSDKYIVCSDFIGCKIYNIHFISCKFIGCNARECDFGGGGVIFENCSFILDEINNTPSLNVKDNYSSVFDSCNMYVKFLNCTMSYLLFENCMINNTNFELSDMNNLIISKCDMKKITLIDVDFSGGKILDTYIEDIEFNDKYKSKIDEKTFFDKIQPKEETIQEYQGLYKTYQVYANICKGNTLNNNFGEYYYQCNLIKQKTLKPFQKIISYVYWITCGFGERIMNALITSFVIMVVFTLLFLLIGIEIDKKEICYIIGKNMPNSFKELITQLNEAFTLSVFMFGGVGTVVAKPTQLSYFVSIIEVCLGIIMTGIGIGTLARKIIR